MRNFLDLLAGQKYLRLLLVCFLGFFLLIGFLFWKRTTQSSFTHFHRHLLREKDAIDVTLRHFKESVRQLRHIFHDKTKDPFTPDPGPYPLDLEAPFYQGLLTTSLPLTPASSEIFSTFRAHAPSFINTFLSHFPHIEGLYFFSKGFSFVSPFAQKDPTLKSDVVKKNMAYSYDLLVQLSHYFSGWSVPQAQHNAWHIRYVYPCEHNNALIGFFSVHIGKAFLKHHLETIHVPFGKLLLVSHHGDILIEKTKKGFQKNSALPRTVRRYIHKLNRHDGRASHKVRTKRYWIDDIPFEHAPWRLIFFANHVSVLNQNLGLLSLEFLSQDLLLIAACALFLLCLNAYLVHYGFIKPVRTLMNRLHQERLNIKTHHTLKGQWSQWENLIAVSFQEKRLRSLKLENSLKERLGDLGRMMDYLEKNQYQLISQEKFVSLGGIAIGVAHEINELLYHTKHLTHHLLQELHAHTKPQAGKEFPTILHHMSQEIDKACRILFDVLLCPGERGSVFVPLAIGPVLIRYGKLAYASFLSKENKKPVVMSMNIPKDPMICLGIEHQLGSAMYSLIAQALESALYGYKTQQDESTVAHVSVTLVKKEYTLVIHIQDSGPAFSKQRQGAFFEKMNHPEDSTDKSDIMPISSSISILQGHDGMLSFDEKDNALSIILPLEKKPDDAGHQDTTATNA
ncbi:hypothetical protein EIL50_03885 [bacterium NHP-B]|nr:hypothetical protein EIL50_03885 [bacterium NHP-B]